MGDNGHSEFDVKAVSLRDHWFPIILSGELGRLKPHGFTLLDRPLLMFRDTKGTVRCLEDRCAHRGTPLSLGKICDGHIRCAYHGWEYDGSGVCTHIPNIDSGAITGTKLVNTLPAEERAGLIWIWAGDPSQADPQRIPAPQPPERDKRYGVHMSYHDFDAHYTLLMANLGDPAHVQFVHDSTLARFSGRKKENIKFRDLVTKESGWPQGKYQHGDNQKGLHVLYDYHSPFNISMLMQGRIRIFDVVAYTWEFGVPLERNKSRFFFLFYSSFLNSRLTEWLMSPLFSELSRRAAAEDRKVLHGQQARLEQGAPFEQLVVYDQLLKRYLDKTRPMETEDDWFSGFRSCRQDGMPSLESPLPTRGKTPTKKNTAG